MVYLPPGLNVPELIYAFTISLKYITVNFSMGWNFSNKHNILTTCERVKRVCLEELPLMKLAFKNLISPDLF